MITALGEAFDPISIIQIMFWLLMSSLTVTVAYLSGGKDEHK
jgi:Na+-driven multidrug efflux pump